MRGHKDLMHALVGCAFCSLEAIEIKASDNSTFVVAATATEYCSHGSILYQKSPSHISMCLT